MAAPRFTRNRSELYAKNAKKGKAVAPPKKPGLPLGKWAMGFLIFVLVGSSVFQFVQFILTQKAPKKVDA